MDFRRFFEDDLNQKLREHPDVLSHVDAIYQFNLGSESWHIDLSGDRTIYPGPHEEADCTIETDQKTFTSILENKKKLVLALLTGKIKIHGKKSLSVHLQEFFR